MIDFIMANADLFGGILVAIALIVYAIFTRQWSTLRVAAYQLMLSAERLMATAEGKAKLDAVFAELWIRVPAWIKKFYDENKMKKKLQDWYNLAKNALKLST